MRRGALLGIVALGACLAWFWIGKASVKKMSNPAVYFEIPVSDLDRAVRFYGAVFGYQFQRATIDHNEMALFPLSEDAPGVSGALAKGEIYVPSKTGSLIYLHTSDIELTLKKVAEAGGKTLYPKTSLGGQGFVAEFEDSEGNRVALHSREM
jgi:predicted enzyme related to lactoylglutathione lyase